MLGFIARHLRRSSEQAGAAAPEPEELPEVVQARHDKEMAYQIAELFNSTEGIDESVRFLQENVGLPEIAMLTKGAKKKDWLSEERGQVVYFMQLALQIKAAERLLSDIEDNSKREEVAAMVEAKRTDLYSQINVWQKADGIRLSREDLETKDTETGLTLADQKVNEMAGKRRAIIEKLREMGRLPRAIDGDNE
jgi:hypothetical protein